MKHFAIPLAVLAFAACQPVTPNDYAGPGSAAAAQAQAAAAAEREAALRGQTGGQITTLPLTVTATPVPVDASPSNPAPAPLAGGGQSTGDISDEQNFDAVAGRESIESDAARLQANRQQYQVIQPTDLPTRPGSLPNIVDYALRTNNPVGVQLYRRFGFNLTNRSIRNCAAYASADLAQQDFLARGGPSRDRRALDPDGDGYACRWTPEPFRIAAGAAGAARVTGPVGAQAPAPVVVSDQ